MLSSFAALSPLLKLKLKKVASIDNLAFKFHYRATFLILLVCTVLVTSRQYIGEHIRCISGGGVPDHVINTFCFFTTTFTVVRHFNESMLMAGALPHPGVGPAYGEGAIKYHAYYQWVPFVLFGQALLFRLPHILWKSWEGGKIKSLVAGLQMISLSKHLTNGNDLQLKHCMIPSQDTVDHRVRTIKTAFFQHIRVNNFWAARLILCECLNFLNLLVQLHYTNRFLSGQFYNLGIDFVHDDFDDGMLNTLDRIFPKVTKCHFYKYGPSGSIQNLDALCVMALNVINEKIFIFLWFWYVLLGFVTIVSLIWRALTMVFHSRSVKFNKFVFSMACPGHLNPWDMLTVTRHSSFSDWLFLYYLAKNMEPYLFRELVLELANELSKMNVDDRRPKSKRNSIEPENSSTLSSGDINRALLSDDREKSN